MPEMTYPNQRIVKVRRERATADFLGIKNENWQAASRDLGAHGLRLYLYLASNRDNYTLALSPAAVRQGIGMARSTYHDQFHKLVDKGYILPSNGNTYEFYETPQSVTQQKNSMLSDGYDFENTTADELPLPQDGNVVLKENIEINNTDIPTNKAINNSEIQEEEKAEIYVPKVIEVRIPRPEAKTKESERLKALRDAIPKAEFTF